MKIESCAACHINSQGLMLHADSRETAFEHQGMPVARFNTFLSPNIHIQILQSDLHTFP